MHLTDWIHMIMWFEDTILSVLIVASNCLSIDFNWFLEQLSGTKVRLSNFDSHSGLNLWMSWCHYGYTTRYISENGKSRRNEEDSTNCNGNFFLRMFQILHFKRTDIDYHSKFRKV